MTSSLLAYEWKSVRAELVEAPHPGLLDKLGTGFDKLSLNG
jgi:hypothetical protein